MISRHDSHANAGCRWMPSRRERSPFQILISSKSHLP
jgi:hypothetical protein